MRFFSFFKNLFKKKKKEAAPASVSSDAANVSEVPSEEIKISSDAPKTNKKVKPKIEYY